MEDRRIVDLYWQRSEDAIEETAQKYGKMLNGISYSLLSSSEDAEECVNDTYVEAWNRMPQDRPDYLGAYLAKIVRCLSINRFRASHRQKRGTAQSLTDELMACIPDGSDLQSEYENRRLTESLNRFLAGLSEEKRRIFLLRYFYSEPIAHIAARMHCTSAKIKTTLFRLRAELKEHLKKEGIPL